MELKKIMNVLKFKGLSSIFLIAMFLVVAIGLVDSVNAVDQN